MTIKVTEQDIRIGLPKDPSWCAVACAIRRQLNCTDVEVKSASDILLFYDHGIQGFHVAQPICDLVQYFIQVFDCAKEFVPPIEFELESHSVNPIKAEPPKMKTCGPEQTEALLGAPPVCVKNAVTEEELVKV